MKGKGYNEITLQDIIFERLEVPVEVDEVGQHPPRDRRIERITS